MPQSDNAEAIRMEEWVALYRKKNPAADRWAVGYGSIHHTVETQARVFAMAELLTARGVQGDGVPIFDVLHAAEPRGTHWWRPQHGARLYRLYGH
jgi:hypothetical protein